MSLPLNISFKSALGVREKTGTNATLQPFEQSSNNVNSAISEMNPPKSDQIIELPQPPASQPQSSCNNDKVVSSSQPIIQQPIKQQDQVQNEMQNFDALSNSTFGFYPSGSNTKVDSSTGNYLVIAGIAGLLATILLSK